MSSFERLLVISTLVYITGLAMILVLYPDSRSIAILLPLSLVGIICNAVLLFVVFKDIFTRKFNKSSTRYFWALLIFLFMPAILVYLPIHGFKSR
jgi:putative effector of murein hydrolase LrgA (UPF0299 family)